MDRTEHSSYLLLIHTGLRGADEKFNPGTLWRKSPSTVRSEIMHELISADSPDEVAQCPPDGIHYFKQLPQQEFDILIAIKTALDRVSVYQTYDWLREGLAMTEGELVDIISLKGIPDRTLGEIRYKGPLPGKLGVHFGVEIKEAMSRRKGTSDGTFKKQRFFRCDEDCGLFVAISKLRLHKDERFSLSLTEDAVEPPAAAVGDHQHAVSLRERVVWLRDSGGQIIPEQGTVLWTGTLPDDAMKEAMVGVEFDNEVGSGTGKYKGMQLFTAKKGHASLVPVIGLLKADEFLGVTSPDVIPARDSFGQGGRSGSSGGSTGVNMEIGTSVVVLAGVYGVVRWIGPSPGSTDIAANKLIAGLEMEIPDPKCYTDGEFCRKRLFRCDPHRAFFVYLHKCQPDDRPRLSDQVTLPIRPPLSPQGGRGIQYENPRGVPREPVELTDLSSSMDTGMGQSLLPILTFNQGLVGRYQGIQGGCNSCYMDSVLIAMFAFTSEYDFLLQDALECDGSIMQIKQTLQNMIVQPLRDNFQVSSQQVMKFRESLDSVAPNEGFTTHMKDSEEFLNYFLGSILHTPEFLNLSTNQGSYLYQLLCMPDKTHVPSVQKLMEYSFCESGVLLDESPSKLILQMPRYGAEKVYAHICVNDVLDTSEIMAGYPRECKQCSNAAEVECLECLQSSPTRTLSDCSFCNECYDEEHSSLGHSKKEIRGNTPSFRRAKREKFRLMAVVCIATSHYACFLRCGKAGGAEWIYADSLAHTTEEGVFSEVWACPEVKAWLQGAPRSDPGSYGDNSSFVKILTQDAYLCFYEKM